MKSIIALALGILFCFTSCDKDNNCESTNAVCKETVPVGEACLAVFSRWFYDKNTNSCSEKSYSGCSQKGFATQAECESCKCN